LALFSSIRSAQPTPVSGSNFHRFTLPPGLTIDEQSGVISGIPSAAGTYQVIITALSLGIGQLAFSAVLEITITPATPAITSPTPVSQ
jgi:Putative Ig domain